MSGLSIGVVDFALGGSQSCAAMSDGGVKCWGSGSQGELGDGGHTAQYTPVASTEFGSDVARVSSGASSTCVMTTAGAVQCVGSNSSGQLGDGTFISSTSAVTPLLSSSVVDISVRNSQACVVTSAGGVTCWGANGSGHLGTYTNYSDTPASMVFS